MKTKGLTEGDDLDKLILALSGGGDPVENERLRQKLCEHREVHENDPKYLLVRQNRHEADKADIDKAEIVKCQDWADRVSRETFQQAVTGLLRKLPEFRDSGDGRVQEVSKQLADAISQPIAKR